MEYSPKKIKEFLEKYNFSFKKSFGQNFIIDENIVTNIVKKAEVDSETLVIEIGPGIGSLTNKLAQSAKNVLCYEIDIKLKEMLTIEFSKFNNVSVIFDDFLNRNIMEDIKEYEYSKLYVVANLPYYITTPILMRFIEQNIPVDKLVVMVQKEVGDRFKAVPGTRDYGSLTVYLNYYFDVKKIMDVSPNVFMPKPNVDSIVVEFSKKQKVKKAKDESLLFTLIRDSFKQKRKTLRNNLKGYDLEKVESVLKRYQMDLSVRAEALFLEVFVSIADELAN